MNVLTHCQQTTEHLAGENKSQFPKPTVLQFYSKVAIALHENSTKSF